MARPSSFNKQAAIGTAMHEIWRSGYEQNSVKAISEKLNITRSSYYNAFGSREALFKAVLAAYFDDSPDRVLYQDPAPRRIRALLTATLRNVCAVRAQDPEGRGCLAVNCVSELAGTHAELGPVLQQAVLDSAARIEDLLEFAVANGELQPDFDVHGAALAVQNLLIGINILSKVVREEDELWLTAKTTLRGLGLLDEEADAKL